MERLRDREREKGRECQAGRKLMELQGLIQSDS